MCVCVCVCVYVCIWYLTRPRIKDERRQKRFRTIELVVDKDEKESVKVNEFERKMAGPQYFDLLRFYWAPAISIIR